MVERELSEDFLAFRSQRHQYLAPITARPVALYEPVCRQTVHQLDRAVMLDLQALGQFTDPWANIPGQAFQRQKQLVLTRLQACPARGLLAETKETADLVP